MALVWMEGFEITDWTNSGINYIPRKYVTAASTTTSTGRLHGQALSLSNGSITTPSLGTDTTWVFGIGCKTSTFNNTTYLQLLGGGVPQFSVTLNASRQVELRRGDTSGTLIATGATQVPSNDWFYLEVKVVLDANASPTVGSYEVRINEIVEINDAGPVRTADTSANVDQFRVHAASVSSFDDIYVLDSDSGGANDFLGDQVIEGLDPNGVGFSTQWTVVGAATNWDAVQDTGLPADDDDYVESDTNGHTDYYEFDNLSFITGAINGVAAIINAQMELAASSRTIRAKFRDSGGTTGNFPSVTINSTNINAFLTILEEDPTAVSTPWSISEIENGQFGVEVVS